MTEHSVATGDPLFHTNRLKDEMQDLIDHLREDVAHVDDTQAQALFETSAEVLCRLKKAFEHYEQKTKKPGVAERRAGCRARVNTGGNYVLESQW